VLVIGHTGIIHGGPLAATSRRLEPLLALGRIYGPLTHFLAVRSWPSVENADVLRMVYAVLL
jgi:hypothetical protein